MRKRNALLISGLIFITSLSGCSGKLYPAMTWKSQPVQADGQLSEWGELLKNYDKDSQLFYEFANDSNTLYLAVKTNSKMVFQQLLSKGITLQIDAEGKNHYPISFQYPYREPHPKMRHGERPDMKTRPGAETETASQQQMPDTSNFRPRPPKGVVPDSLKMPPMMMGHRPMGKIKISGFNSDITDSIMNVKNSYGFQAGMSLQDTTLCIEAAIPLATFFKDQLSATDTIQPMAFKIIIQKADHFMPSGNRGGMSGGHGGGPGGGPGGGMPPGGGMGGGPGGGGPGGGGPGGGGMPQMGGAQQQQSGVTEGKEHIIKCLMRLSIKNR